MTHHINLALSVVLLLVALIVFYLSVGSNVGTTTRAAAGVAAATVSDTRRVLKFGPDGEVEFCTSHGSCYKLRCDRATSGEQDHARKLTG